MLVLDRVRAIEHPRGSRVIRVVYEAVHVEELVADDPEAARRAYEELVRAMRKGAEWTVTM